MKRRKPRGSDAGPVVQPVSKKTIILTAGLLLLVLFCLAIMIYVAMPSR